MPAVGMENFLSPEETRTARNRRYYLAHRETIQQKVREWDLLRLYGITVEEFDRMLIAQFGRCGMCNNPMTRDREPQVDHDHSTGKVRELLCSTYNKVLGMLKDNVELLEKAISYILRHSTEEKAA